MERVSEHELAIWRYFVKTHALIIEQIELDLANQKRVPLTTYDVLIALYEAPEQRLRLGELVHKTVLSKSGLSRLVDRLAREGLLRKEKSHEDGRGAYAVLTDDGERELRKAWPIYAKGIKNYFAAPLSIDQRNSLQQALYSLYESMKQLGQEDEAT
mgnify:CR=1 FL=1